MKNDILYIYMGSETFVDSQDYGYTNDTITLGYSTLRIPGILRSSYGADDSR